MCRYSPDWDLSTIPDDKIRSEWGRRTAALRAVKTGGRNSPGRPPVLTACPRGCGATGSAREMRAHRCPPSEG